MAAIGVAAKSPAFWSQADASQLAPSAAGSAPPITKPKNRGPAIPMVAGDPKSSSIRMTSAGAHRPIRQRFQKCIQTPHRFLRGADTPILNFFEVARGAQRDIL